jgi:hypothetical protein
MHICLGEGHNGKVTYFKHKDKSGCQDVGMVTLDVGYHPCIIREMAKIITTTTTIIINSTKKMDID